MFGAKLNPSRETVRLAIIDELNSLGVYETLKGESIKDLCYYELRALLAKKKAVAQ